MCFEDDKDDAKKLLKISDLKLENLPNGGYVSSRGEYKEVGIQLAVTLPNGKRRVFRKVLNRGLIDIDEISPDNQHIQFNRVHDISTAHRAIKRLVVREYNEKNKHIPVGNRDSGLIK